MMKDLLAQRVNPDVPSALSGLFPKDDDPRAISFAAGSPNEDLFPVQAMRTAFDTAMINHGAHLFQYQTSQGNADLRAQLARRIGKWGQVQTTADHVVLTVGGQQALELVAKTLLNPGDEVVVEAPSYVGALAAFDLYAPTYYGVPLQNDGIDLNALEDTLKQHPNIKLLYTVPDYHNPTGITMSVAKRQQLVALANKYDFVILEDSPYRDLGYEHLPLPAVKAFDTEGRVIFVSSMSKILMPGLRTGWLVADGDLLTAILRARQASDLETNNIVHAAIDAYLAANDLDAHVDILKADYQRKCAAMVQALEDYFPDEATFTRPDGGFFDWVTLPEELDADALLSDTIIPQAHVSYVPSTNFYPDRNVRNGFRLSFTGLAPEAIDEGMHRLGDQIKAALHAAKPVV